MSFDEAGFGIQGNLLAYEGFSGPGSQVRESLVADDHEGALAVGWAFGLDFYIPCFGNG